MDVIIKGPKDFWTGALYCFIGAAALYMARDFGMGTAARMGPGYFPTILGGLLVLFGAVSVVRAFVRVGEPIGAIAWKPIFLITGGTVCFAFLLRTAGLPIALLALLLISASGSSKFKFDWRATLAMFALVLFCALVFVKGLGVPMPLLGRWFGV